MSKNLKPPREWIEVHPACAMFPQMSSAELKELAEDISNNQGGLQHEPVVLKYKDGRLVLIDGRNRQDALEMMMPGEEVDTQGRYLDGEAWSEDDLVSYIISANIRRRPAVQEPGGIH